MMAKTVKGGTVAVELVLDKDQFQKDFKRVGKDVVAEQSRLSLEMQRNKVRFAVEDANSTWAEKMFGSTVLGRIRTARTEVARLNEQIALQTAKTDLSRNNWASLVSRGASAGKIAFAEKDYLRNQAALARLKQELNNTSSAAAVMGGAMRSAALVGVGAVVTLTTAYAAAVRAAAEWGQAVNDIADETGLADEEAAKLLGTMRVIGMSSEEAAGALAKMSRSITESAVAQDAASKAGRQSDDVFTKYGIAIRDADGALLSHSEVLANITEVHRSMRDGVAKTSMEMDIFGRSGYKLNDLLNMTSQRSDEVALTLAKMGLSTGLNSQKFEDLNQQLNMARLALTSIANTITGGNTEAITALIGKLTDLAIWIKENDAALNKLSAVFGLVNRAINPMGEAVDYVKEKLKEGIEAYNQYLKATQQNNPPGDVTNDMVETQNKNIDAARKKNNEAVLKRLEQDQKLLDSARELNVAIMELSGQALAVQLANIDTEEKRWAEKTKNQAAASRWAEAARLKAFNDAQARIDAGLKSYEAAQQRVKSAVAGVRGAFQGAFGSAISETMEEYRKGNYANAAYNAVQKMRDEFELRRKATRAVAAEAGYSGREADFFDPESPWEAVNQSFENLRDAITEADKAKLEYLKTIAQNTAVKPQTGVSITIPVTVDGKQLGQAAAKIILPPVQEALSQNPTSFGGGNR